MNRDPKYSCGSNFCFEHGRYCNYCSICHSDKSKPCKRVSEEWNRDRGIKVAGYEDSAQYRRLDKDDRNKADDRYEGDDRPGKNDRYQKSEEHALGHRNTLADPNQEELHKGHPEHKHSPCKQTHVHEYLGSTKSAESSEDTHNHRFAGISGEAVISAGSHIHKVWTRTDFFDHLHYIEHYSGPAIYMSKDISMADRGNESVMREEPHIHFVTGLTSINGQHNHAFQFATLIDSPLLPGA